MARAGGGTTEPGRKAGGREARPFSPHRHERPDSGDAFIADPQDGPAHTDDDLAESLAEDFVLAATSGEEQGEEHQDAMLDEELGGPFIATTGDEEYALETDPMLPPNASREPLPRAGASLIQQPVEDDDEGGETD